MDLSLDFLSYRQLIRYLVVFAVVLIGGYVAKDLFAILVIVVILFYALKKSHFKSIELALIWLFCYGFYSSQGYMANEIVSRYIAKPPFTLFIIFLMFFRRVPREVANARFVISWLIFLCVSLLSIVYHAQSPFILITVSSFFLVYFILAGTDISAEQCVRLLNLFVAVAVLQTFVSVLQVSQLISPPTKMMDDGAGGQFQWVAGLDDVASGTFGAAASSSTSWYAALTALFLILIWTQCRKGKYLLVTMIALAQFVTVDSKTIMGVTAAMMIYLFYYLNKHRLRFNLNTKRFLAILLFGGLVGYGAFSAWSLYYTYQSQTKKGDASRGNLNAVYKDEIARSEDLVISNIADWGKIQGFRYVFDDFVKEDYLEVLFGYGLLGFTYNGKMHYIESRDTRLMQLNNFTRSRSSLINQFAQGGVIGFVQVILMLYLWAKYNRQRDGQEEIDAVIRALVHIFLPFTLIAAFVYSVSFTSLTVIGFAALISVLKTSSGKVSDFEESEMDRENYQKEGLEQ